MGRMNKFTLLKVLTSEIGGKYYKKEDRNKYLGFFDKVLLRRIT